MDRLIHYFFNLAVMRRYLPDLLHGLGVTVALAALVIAIGLAVGFALAIVRALQVRPINWVLIPVVDLFRAVPPLVIIVVVYFALPYAGLRLSSFVSTVVSLAAVLAAFAEEIFWAGIISVERGQWEAARSTGLGYLETLGLVVLPQAVRLALPPLTNWTIAITKGTALGSAVAVQEIISQAQSAQSTAANPSPLTLGAFLYLAIFAPLVAGSRWVERRVGGRP
ncbi:MAG TPA: amino acid ABC transporter permease [Methylomirabilota bacterium]|jgi:polar amino acid transport system permease protein|nr:amino acid ABC transporter permease [Methylomirabilota bacterium]